AIYHNEVMDSLTKTDVAMRPFPRVALTYQEWSRSGRIPDHLTESSRQFILLRLTAFVKRQLMAGDTAMVRYVLHNLPTRSRSALHWWLWLLSYIPPFALRWVFRFLVYLRRRLRYIRT